MDTPRNRTARRYGYTGTNERARCVCEVGHDAHREHGRPRNQVGKHWDPRCPHSELMLHTVVYPTLRKRLSHTKAKARTLIAPMIRIVAG